MTISRDADAYTRERQARAVAKTMGMFRVATVSPFTVYLDGASVAVPGLKIVGQSYSVGDTGVYWLRQGQLPVCQRTTT